MLLDNDVVADGKAKAGAFASGLRRKEERILAESEESDNRHKALVSALDVLNERERRIFEARRLADDPITLEELAAEFGVSRERVRQIEMRAFEKIQKAVKARIGTIGRQPAALAVDFEVCHV
jgi:RNA polymerase sigma-32 factor